MSNKQIVLGSHTVALSAFGSATDESGKLIGARQFIAAKFGITLPKVVKGAKGPTMKEVKTRILAIAGNDEAAIKAASKEYDAARSAFYSQSALFNGQMAADPTLRKSVRLSISKKTGECIGATTTYRKEKSQGALSAAATRIAQLEAQLARLTALPAPAAS